MKNIGEYVVYKKEVCKVKEIKEKYMKGQDYYRLVPIGDETLYLDIPIDKTKEQMRELIDKEQVEKIIKKIPKIELVEAEDKMLETEYKNLLNSESLENYIRIIKTTYLRNQKRKENKKKISEVDNHYFNLAEKYLYNEFSIVLNKTYEETKQYVIEKVINLSK